MGNRNSTAALALVCLTGPTASEEQSIMAGCQMSQNDILAGYNFNSNAICDGGFRSMAFFTGNQVNGATYDKEVVVILAAPYKIVSSFVINVIYGQIAQDRIGTSAFYIGNSSTAFSTSLTKCTPDIFDGGFFMISPPTTGQYVVLRRIGGAVQNYYSINEIRLYQTQNLLLERAAQVTISAPVPTNSAFPATNLITNLGNRSGGSDLPPRMNASGIRAAYQSCYKTSNIELAAEGHILKVFINLGEPLFIHSVLVVQDLFTGWQANAITDETKFLQNFEIHIGPNAEPTLNWKCPGGPFMVTSDTSNRVNVSTATYTGLMWNFGKEAWCNMEGQYIGIVADLIHYGTAGVSYLMTICQLGAFGTKYVRLTPVPSTLWILRGTTFTLNVENIAADSTLPIGNTLDIWIRQLLGTEQAWVTITQGNPTVITFAPTNTLALGEYVVSLQSYDNNGGVYSTLKQDVIAVTVYPAECLQALSQSSAFETTQPIVIVKEYSPTIYFPEKLFTGPHTYTGFVCGGTYTQTITMSPPVPGVVLTDQPTGTDLRPNIAISSSAPSGATFTLTFTGRYVHAPTSTDITASFTQTYQIKTVFSTDYLDQPTITHSLTPGQLTFFVPPDAVGNTPPIQTLTLSGVTVAYPIKAGTPDVLGNLPPAITPVPYAGFSSTQIVKGQSSLGWPTLTSPQGTLLLQGGPDFSGDLNTASTATVAFTCDSWSSLFAKTTLPKTLIFKNSVEPNFGASIQVKCAYGESYPPTFFLGLESIELVASNPTQWVLPTVLQGSFNLAKVKFEPDAALGGLFTFDEATRTVSFRGSQSIGDLCGKQFGATVTLVNLIGQESRFSQALVFAACPVLDAALLTSKLAQSLIRQEPISVEKLEATYMILPKTSTVETFTFADPLAQAVANGATLSEGLVLSGIKIKVVSNSIPSAVQATQITYDRLGFGLLELTADGTVAQELLDKQLANKDSESFLKGVVLVEVSDLSPEGKKSFFVINYLFQPTLDQPTSASDKDVQTKAEPQPTVDKKSTASDKDVQTKAEPQPTVDKKSTASDKDVQTKAEPQPTVDKKSTASDIDVQIKAELVDEIIRKRLELLQETSPQIRQQNPLSAKIEQVSKSGELQIQFSNSMVMPDADKLKTLSNESHEAGDADGTHDRLARLLLELLNESKILSINYDRFDEGDAMKFSWRITSMTALSMEVRLQFDEPLQVSAEGLDRVSVTFNSSGLLFDRFGSEIESDYKTNQKHMPKQFASKADAEFSKAIAVFGQPIDIDDPPTKFTLNTLLAGGLQQILSAMATSEIIVLIPYFDILMPAHVEALFDVLLQISAFEAIPTESLFVDMKASLQSVTIDPNAERFEDLGFSGTWMLINLGSTFVVFGLISSGHLLLCCIPERSERCPKLTGCARKCRDSLKFGYLLRQFKESYVIIVTASLLNIKFVSWSDAKDVPAAQANLVLSYALLGVAAVYPAVQQWCLHRNRHRLNTAAFRQRYGAAYENLRLGGTRHLLYPLFSYYRRLLLPIAILYFDAGLIGHFLTLNLTGIATVALLLKQKPFEQGNTWEICEELSVVVISYHILGLSWSVQTYAAQYSIGTSFLVCISLQLLVFLLSSSVAWFRTRRRNFIIWQAQRGVQRSIEARSRARAQQERSRIAQQAQESSDASLSNSSSSDSNEEESHPGNNSPQSLSIVEEEESSQQSSQMIVEEESESLSVVQEEESSLSSSQMMAPEESESLSQDAGSTPANDSNIAIQEERKVTMDFMRQSYFDKKRANFEKRLLNTIDKAIHGQIEPTPRSPVGVFAQMDMVRDSELHELGLDGIYDKVLSPKSHASHLDDQCEHPSLSELDQVSQEPEGNEGDLESQVVHVQTITVPQYRPKKATNSRVAPASEDPVTSHSENRQSLAYKQRFSMMTKNLQESGYL